MVHQNKFKQYPEAGTMHPWEWMQKWQLDIETAAGLLAIKRPDSFYRWHPNSKGEKRSPNPQIQVACSLYDQMWQQAGCPYQR